MTAPIYPVRWLTSFFAVIVLVTSCSSSAPSGAFTDPEPTSAPSTNDLSKAPSTSDDAITELVDLRGELQSAIDEWEGDVDGGGVAFVRDEAGQVYAIASGANPETGEPLQADDRVRVGSISKVFTAVMVMQLVDEGLVELDAPVSTYVADLELANDVTIRELLGHRSGIPNYTAAPGFFAVILTNPDREPEPVDLIAFTNGGSDFEPGSEFSYSNTNFIVAGMVIESVTNMTLNEALDQRINTPLGLADTGFDDGGFTDVVGGFSSLMPSGNSYDQSYTAMARGAWAAGSLVTTVEELGRFLDAVLLSDELIGAERRVEMLGEIESGADYGLGLHPGPDFGVGHGGAIGGFSSIAEVDLETMEMVIVVVNNDAREPAVLSGKLAEVLEGSS